MLLKIKLLAKKIFFGFSLLHYYFFKENSTLIKSSKYLGQRKIYESKLFLSMIDKLFVNTNQFSHLGHKKINQKQNKNHVVICLTGLLDPKKKSHSWLYYLWAKMYLEADNNNKVTFFITNEHIYLKYFLKKESSIEKEYFQDFQDLKHDCNDNRFNYHALETSTTNFEINIKKACKQILNLNPTHLVFFSGWNCDSPFVRKILFNLKPIVYHITQDTHQIPTYAHLMIVPRFKKQWYSKKSIPVLDIDSYYWGKKENIPLNIHENKHTINKFKKHHKPVVIATILGGKRILNTLSKYSTNELNIFIDFINNNNVVWYLIGLDSERGLFILSDKLRALIESKKIVILKYKTSIDEFLVDVDIYCHLPKLIGGGGSALTALNKKTVLICDSSSDVARILEDKYIYDNFQAYFKNLEELTNNTEKRVETMIAQNLYLNRYSENEVYEITSKKMKKATALFYKHKQS
jgi:hypothetical protein